jgi:cytochrome c-type biogenesis protein CcmE
MFLTISTHFVCRMGGNCEVMKVKTKNKVLLAGLLIAGVMGALIFMGVAQTASYYMTVDEFFEKQDKLSDRSLKLSGFIVGESVDYDPQNLKLAFDITDEAGEQQLSVVYEGVKPDTFIDGWETIIEGRINEEGVFIATELLVKCPSKYESEEYQYDSEDYEYESEKPYDQKD